MLAVVHLDHRFRGIGERLGIVHFLQRHPALLEPFHLADKEHRGNRIVIGGMNGDRRIGRAGSPADETNARPTARPRIRHRHEPRAAFVPANDEPNRRMVDQRVGHGEIALPRHTIGDIDFMAFQRGGKKLGSGAGHGVSPI